MDKKLVASKQDYEVRYIADKFNISEEKVLEAMLAVWNNGKYCRSRKMIYAKIREQMEVEKMSEIIVEGLQMPTS